MYGIQNVSINGGPSNLRRLHLSKNNHQKIIVIGQIIGSGQIDSFVCIESIILSMHYVQISVHV